MEKKDDEVLAEARLAEMGKRIDELEEPAGDGNRQSQGGVGKTD